MLAGENLQRHPSSMSICSGGEEESDAREEGARCSSWRYRRQQSYSICRAVRSLPCGLQLGGLGGSQQGGQRHTKQILSLAHPSHAHPGTCTLRSGQGGAAAQQGRGVCYRRKRSPLLQKRRQAPRRCETATSSGGGGEISPRDFFSGAPLSLSPLAKRGSGARPRSAILRSSLPSSFVPTPLPQQRS